jgi:hypothetical protein
MLGSNDLHVAPPRNRGGTADCARTRTSRSCAAAMSAAAVAARSEPSPRLSRSATRLLAANSWLFIGSKQP